MQNDLRDIDKKMADIKDGQDGLKGEVKSLRRRMDRIRKMRDDREEWMRKQQELKEKQMATRGVASTGPLAIISMAKALAVATFVGEGKEISHDESKKSD